ncbi:MAG: hypothetical protein ACXWG1_00105 [Usitatibacter sp.]
MLKSSASLLGIAATVLSLNLPANESVPGLSLAQIRADVHPAVAHLEAAPAQAFDSTDSSNNASGGPNAWLCALGFLGLVVLRRTRSGPMM